MEMVRKMMRTVVGFDLMDLVPRRTYRVARLKMDPSADTTVAARPPM